MTPKSPTAANQKQDDPEQSRRFLDIAEANRADKDVLKEAVKKLAAEPRIAKPQPKKSGGR